MGRGGWGSYQQSVSCFPRHLFIALSPHYIWRSFTPYVLSLIHLQGSPKPQEEPPGLESCEELGDPMSPTPPPASLSPAQAQAQGPRHSPGLSGWAWGERVTPAANPPTLGEQ